jgi:hypothetical protein
MNLGSKRTSCTEALEQHHGTGQCVGQDLDHSIFDLLRCQSPTLRATSVSPLIGADQKVAGFLRFGAPSGSEKLYYPGSGTLVIVGRKCVARDAFAG